MKTDIRKSVTNSVNYCSRAGWCTGGQWYAAISKKVRSRFRELDPEAWFLPSWLIGIDIVRNHIFVLVTFGRRVVYDGSGTGLWILSPHPYSWYMMQKDICTSLITYLTVNKNQLCALMIEIRVPRSKWFFVWKRIWAWGSSLNWFCHYLRKECSFNLVA